MKIMLPSAEALANLLRAVRPLRSTGVYHHQAWALDVPDYQAMAEATLAFLVDGGWGAQPYLRPPPPCAHPGWRNLSSRLKTCEHCGFTTNAPTNA